MYAFPVERTTIQNEPFVPPRRSLVGETARSAALEAREEHQEGTNTDTAGKRGSEATQVEQPVPSEGKGTLVDLIL